MSHMTVDDHIQRQAGSVAAVLEAVVLALPEDKLDAEVCVKCLAVLALDMTRAMMYRMGGSHDVQMVGEKNL